MGHAILGRPPRIIVPKSIQTEFVENMTSEGSFSGLRGSYPSSSTNIFSEFNSWIRKLLVGRDLLDKTRDLSPSPLGGICFLRLLLKNR